MDTTIITAAISASATVAVGLVPYLSKDKKLRKCNDELGKVQAQVNLTVSTGVAIGYYYNFIKEVFLILGVNDEIAISVEKKDSKNNEEDFKRSFKSDKVEIQIILPPELTGGGIAAMHSRAAIFRKGGIIRKEGIRNFDIKLFIDNENDRLIIVDTATPLNGVRHYLENLDEYKNTITQEGSIQDRQDTQEFRIRQRREISNFEAVIKHYAQKESYGDKKLSFLVA